MLTMGSILSWVWRGAPEDPALDIVDPRSGMTPREVKIVQDDWQIVKKNLIPIGVDIFIILFQRYPDYQDSFHSLALVPLEELRTNKKMAAHASTVMYALTNVVDSLLDPDVDLELLRKIGKNHGERHLTRAHFEHVKVVIVDVLQSNLQWKDEKSVEAWTRTLEFMYKGIYEGLDQVI